MSTLAFSEISPLRSIKLEWMLPSILSPTLSIFVLLIFYFSKILGSVSKGCPLLEYIDMGLVVDMEDLLPANLIALASLRLCSVFISVYFSPLREITPEEIEDFRVSIDAIVEQELLEVRITSYFNTKIFLPPLKLDLSRNMVVFCNLLFPINFFLVLIPWLSLVSRPLFISVSIIP